MAPSPTTPIWLITGSSRGIGLALTRHALSQGHTVIATSRNPSSTPALVAEVQSHPTGTGHWLPLDVTAADLEDAVRQAEGLYGRIDVLVNNAAYAVLGAVEEVPPEVVREQMETNFVGPVRVMQAVLPGMRRRRKGVIVNVSSASGIISVPGNGVYSASKFALEAASEALSREVEGWGVRVAVMVLGAFRTGFGKVEEGGVRVVGPREGGGYDVAVDGGEGVVARRVRLVGGMKESARGDPERAAGMIFDVAVGREGVWRRMPEGDGEQDGKRKEEERFLRLVLGEDSWAVGWSKIEDLRETWEAQREYAKGSAVEEE